MMAATPLQARAPRRPPLRRLPVVQHLEPRRTRSNGLATYSSPRLRPVGTSQVTNATVPVRCPALAFTSILIIDDCPEDRTAVRLFLLRAGAADGVSFTIAESANGEDGLAACGLHRPDCILLDYYLPDMDGLEFLARIKTLAGHVPLPVVVLTGSEDQTIASAALSAGAQEYLPKRLMGSELLLRAVQSAQDRFGLHTAQRATQAELASRNELLKITLGSIGDGVITTDIQGRVTWLNPVATALTGLSAVQAVGCTFSDLLGFLEENSSVRPVDPMSACMMQGAAVDLAAGATMLTIDGHEHGVEGTASPIRDEAQNILGAVMVFRDVTSQRRLGREIAHRATHDALTGLANRELFEDRIKQLLEDFTDDAVCHSLFILDLDQFKRINDTCGHAGGDQFLRRLSTLLTGSLRSHDLVARLGGDEFGMILMHCSSQSAERIGKNICQAIDEFRFIYEGQRFRVGASIGLVSFDRSWKNHNELLNAGDSACYAAKETGRNRVYVWRDDDAAINSRRSDMVWHQSLEVAIDEGRFELFGQRIEDIDGSGGPSHVEVLLRLQQPDGSLVLPGVFFPTAERFHLASRIDRWVIGQIFERLNRLGSLGPGIASIAVNLSGQSIADKDFHTDIQTMLTNASFDVGSLCFEITETVAITDLYGARRFIDAVRQFGVKVVLDDFGAGACSFNYLKTLPVDAIKIDGHLIVGLIDDSVNVAAVRCFRDVAEALGLGCVAEFVESDALLDAVRGLGIAMAQGYLIHRPEPLWPLIAQSATRGARLSQ